MVVQPSESKYPRNFVNVIDEIASKDPERTCFSIPAVESTGRWEDVSFGRYANSINRISHWMVEEVGLAEDGTYPTVAYIGPNDARYVVMLVAALKAGYKTLFISTRNNMESQLSLFEASDCHWICYAPEFESIVQPWMEARPMKASSVGSLSQVLDTQKVPSFPYGKSLDEVATEPVMVLHTSGSTGIPKPIICRHGMIAVSDAYHNAPEFSGYPHIWKKYSDRTSRVICTMPMFHALGMYVFIAVSIYWDRIFVLPRSDQPMTPDTICEMLEQSSVDAAIIPPSVLGEMSHDSAYIDKLSKLASVVTGGGGLDKDAGDRLVNHGVILTSIISSTEAGVYPLYIEHDPKYWNYFIFDNDQFGCEYRPVGDGVYEQVIIRKEKSPGMQGIFYTFPDATEFYTNDLYRPHPDLANYWLHVGRADNIIAFSNGEKLNPATIESMVGDHLSIQSAIVVGQGKFQAALVLDPIEPLKDEGAAQKLIDSVWPVIEEANNKTVTHGRIARHLIIVSSPDKPVPYSSKGSLQRGAFLKLYKDEIDALYETSVPTENVSLDFASEDATIASIENIFISSLKVSGLQPDSDFFDSGMDSLQVINLTRLLNSGIRANDSTSKSTELMSRDIYRNPTLRKLARYVSTKALHGTSQQPDTNGVDEAAKDLFQKYSAGIESLPMSSQKPAAYDQNQTVLLTGSTGSLGSYLLHLLEQCPSVTKILCLNRSSDGGKEKQLKASQERDLTSNFSKTTFLHADMSQANFGLDAAIYEDLLNSVDRVIHNAWPVNFNLSVDSFEPHIKGVRQLVDFASHATKRAHLVFISSIGTVDGWTGPDPVPESPLTDLSIASTGYGQSKLVGDMILQQASEKVGISAGIVRVGQIAGPRSDKGMWNAQEWLPTIISSSVYMGKLPSDIAAMDTVDWVPVEDVAATLLEIAGVTSALPSSVSSHFNIVNPSTVSWSNLAPAVKEFFQRKDREIELVSFDSWVESVEAHSEDEVNVPAVKLLDTYKGMLIPNGTQSHYAGFSTSQTRAVSATLNALGPVDSQMMENWCQQWGF